MDIIKAIKGRRSVRKFKNRPVSSTRLKQIIEAGIWSPTACDIQGWRFIVVRDKGVKQRLIASGIRQLKDTPVGIFVLYDNRTHNKEYSDYVQSGAACIQNMLLKAYSLGLGTCWVCNLPRQRVIKKLLDVPRNYDVIALVKLGYPAERPSPPKRRHQIDNLICENRFEFNIETPPKIRNLGLVRKLFKHKQIPTTEKFKCIGLKNGIKKGIKRMMNHIDRIIGVFGLLLKKNFPKLYYQSKRLKDKIVK